MRPRFYVFTILALCAIAAVGFWRLSTAPLQSDPQQPDPVIDDGRPKLVVMVVFDQMRGDYLKKWQPLFVEGGFKRLQTDGAWFTNCHYPYAYTLTAPGHTSLSTGSYPAKHGIIANDWYQRKEAKSVSSVTPPPSELRRGLGPYRRRVESVGDHFLKTAGKKGRVVSLSIKDRAAILMAALRAYACYWFDNSVGQFVTSPYYRDEPHSWVKSFNKAGLAESWINKDWIRLDPNLDYTKYSGPDDFFAEGTGYGQGIAFPHPIQFIEGKTEKEQKAARKHYYEAMENSPYGNELLLQFAKTAIEAEKLGQGNTVDLLCLSFSSNDLVGHCWGPDSQEVLDITLRSDRAIKELLDLLDAKVGKGKYVFSVSADHGVCPLPEFAAKEGKMGGRAAPEILTSLAEAHLNRTFLPEGAKAQWFIAPAKYNAWVYLNLKTIAELKLEPSKVERSLADWFATQEGVQQAFTRTELTAPAAADDSRYFQAMRKSFRPEASGDVMVLLKPYYLFSPPILSKDPAKNESYRTTHGTPHEYDTHVPLLVMGPGITPGVRDDRVAPQQLSSILAEMLRSPAPNGEEFPVPAGLIAQSPARQ